jgi:hypothetical protein
MERDNKKRKRDTSKMKDTIYQTTIRFSWEDVQAQAEDSGITLTERQAKKQFESIRWGLREALIEAGNRAIADNLEVTT